MPFRDAPPLTRAVVLRAIGFGVAVILGAIAIWMIVTGTDQKGIKIGFLAGLWGVLLGAYSMFGSRRQGEDGDARTEVPVLSSTDVELRSGGEVERIAEAAARRAFEERLQAMIRTELAAAMSREVSDLRAEIARLRGDLLEKVGGQLRLERIETTRLIGSDLEALQHEVRQLKAASESGTLMAELGLDERSVHRIVDSDGASETVRTVTEVAPRPDLRKAERAEPADRPEKAERPEKADKSSRKRAAAEKAEAERVAAERAEAERVAAEKAAADRAAADKAAAERAEAERAAAEKAAADKAAAEKAAADTAARERAVAERAERQRAAAERAAAAKAAAERAQREKAEREQAERAKAARETAAAEKAAAERAAAEKAAAERAAADRAAERAAAERAAEKARAALNPPGGPQRTPWMPPTPPQRSRPSPAETTGPVPPLPGGAGRETVRGTWTPPAPSAPRPAPQPAAAGKADPFADLPRITPFTEFELDPIETRPAPTPDGYTGRRRASADEAETPDVEAGSGRHSQAGAEADPAERPGRRHRRAEENSEANELLAKLLARESAQR